MEGSVETGTAMQRPNSAFSFGASQMAVLPARQQLSPSLSPDSGKRPGIPPSHPNNPLHSMPYSKPNSVPRSGNWQPSQQSSSPGPSHTRSLSQPSFFSLDCLPPLSPSPHREASPSSLSDPAANEVSMEENVVNSHVPSSLPSPSSRGSLPPRKGHRRSSSDILLGFSAMIQSSPQLIPISSRGVLDGSVSGRENPIQLVKPGQSKDRDGARSNGDGMGEKRIEGDTVDDLFSAYMNLDNIDKVHSPGTEDKDFDSRVSASKSTGCESSDNEVESSVNGRRREGVKRSAGGDIAPTTRHYRSLSMDSYMDDFQLDDDSLKLLPLGGTGSGLQSPGSLVDGNSAKFSMEFGNGDFSAAEMKKIMESDKLTEIALSDPKRAKRILANRQSAARSKERRSRYISELEHKVQTLQTEATTLSAQVTKLQRDSVGLTSQNSELKFRLQAMEQQAQLKDALNEALGAEVQRLKLAAAEFGGDAHLSSCMAQQLSLNQQMFHNQMQHQQSVPLNLYQMQQQQQQQQALQSQQRNEMSSSSSSQQRNGKVAEHEAKQ